MSLDKEFIVKFWNSFIGIQTPENVRKVRRRFELWKTASVASLFKTCMSTRGLYACFPIVQQVLTAANLVWKDSFIASAMSEVANSDRAARASSAGSIRCEPAIKIIEAHVRRCHGLWGGLSIYSVDLACCPICLSSRSHASQLSRPRAGCCHDATTRDVYERSTLNGVRYRAGDSKSTASIWARNARYQGMSNFTMKYCSFICSAAGLVCMVC